MDNNQFVNSILSYSNAGATSLFTNINDMSKWVMNFYGHKVGDEKDIEMLTKKGKLNSGKELTYASGIAVDTYRGWRQYAHSGGDAGYRTFVSVFPDLKMGFIVFSNHGNFNPGGKANEMAALFIKDSTVKKEEINKPKRDSAAAVIKDSLSIKKYLGYYLDDNGLPFSFDIKNSRLYYHIRNQSDFLVKESENTFSIFSAPEIKFVFAIKGKDTTVDIKTPDQLYHLSKYIPGAVPDDPLLQTYTGTYYCPELDCKYGIILKDHQLLLTNDKYKDTKLTVVSRDHLINDSWWINHIKMLRNSKDQVTGFEVNSGRVEHLKFIRLEHPEY